MSEGTYRIWPESKGFWKDYLEKEWSLSILLIFEIITGKPTNLSKIDTQVKKFITIITLWNPCQPFLGLLLQPAVKLGFS